MVTRMLVLTIVLTITLAITMPAPAAPDFATAKPIIGYPDFEIVDNGNLVYERDSIVAKRGSTRAFGFLIKSLNEQAVSACEAVGYPSSLADTGGLPALPIPIASLLAGGALIRKSVAG